MLNEDFSNKSFKELLSPKSKLKFDSKRTAYVEIGLLRLLFYSLNSYIIGENSSTELRKDLVAQIKTLWFCNGTLSEKNENSFHELKFFFNFRKTDNENPSCELLRRSIKQYTKGYYDSAMLLYLTAVFLKLKLSQHEQYYYFISLFLIQLNRVRSTMCMNEGSGLKKFVNDYYGALTRKFKQNNIQNPPRSTFMNGTTHVEYRQSCVPNIQQVKLIEEEICRTVKHHYREHYLSSCNYETFSINPVFKYNFTYHFLKIKDSSKYTRYQKTIERLKKSTNELLHFFNTSESNCKSLNYFSEGQKKWFMTTSETDECIDLRLLVRALDAAGDENLLPPEVFAPFARKIRKSFLNLSQYYNDKYIKSIRFTFHAGEDFACIVTGMRRIDETISFMEYQQNDRLGHALAIGLSPQKWMHDKGEILISQAEYFDNCVWLCQKAKEMMQINTSFGQWVIFYERKIAEYQKVVLGVDTPIATELLWNAYSLRRNLMVENEISLEWDEDYFPDFYRKSPINNFALSLFNHYKNLQYLGTDSPYHKAEKNFLTLRYKSFFSSPDNENYICISDDELDFWEAAKIIYCNVVQIKKLYWKHARHPI